MLRGLAASAFSTILRLRRGLYRQGILPTYRASLPTVSIGNLTVGGTGKTPVTIYLAEKLLQWEMQPLILLRGYRSRAEKSNRIVRQGKNLLRPQEVGDEAHLLALRLPRAVVVAGRHRSRSAEMLRPFPENGVILLDDAFQHLAVHRDLDLVTIDSTDPFGNERLLPAGKLREPLSALARADALLLTRAHLRDDTEPIFRKLRRWNAHSPIFRFGHRFPGLTGPGTTERLDPARELQGARVVLLAALGNPEQFEADAVRLGAVVTGCFFFRDHHRYDVKELRSIARKAREEDAFILTTEKDAVKIAELPGEPLPLRVLRLESRPLDEEPFEDWLRTVLEKVRRNRQSELSRET